ncbi:GlsB/YeaQ/YmgE family stress response membrane protein [Rubrobacter marinus]|uniref:GlsB/YeaQ/YmgE family stress response membrane protein n=1 Tax=Rubrobacter marinus TaxID=2653852 RepID=A0A6G8PTE9_9ACTN|nr:GlsB/YeaQ/YmgE family stress response membrane protein [Rubrobacter marinus]QIN77769.1 GlsB/YeaQ/YmgE family stress response membrane protein [Rubrobacter marinus]
MGILAWIVVGLVAGILAKIAMPGPDPGGIILTVVIGIAGAVVGGLIVNAILGRPGVTGFDLPTVLVATLGAVLLLAVYRFVTRRAV